MRSPRSYPMMRRKASFPSMIRPSRFQMKIPMMLESTKRRIFASNPLANARTAVSLFARGDLQFEVFNRLNGLVRQGGELSQGIHDRFIFRIELAAIAVRDRPYCPDSLAPDVKRDQQALFHRGRYRDEVWVTPLEVSEQQCTVLIEHVSAGTEIARRPAANMPFPFASNGWPIKPFPTIILR